VGVIIGMDPHKRSATIKVVDERGRIIEGGRFGTDKTGYAEMLDAGRRHPDRSGRSGAAMASGCTSRTGSCTTVRSSLTCRRSCPSRCGSSPPATAARPTSRRALSGDGRATHSEPGAG
jgi:hypothetical protein